jgi:hypothetical protein
MERAFRTILLVALVTGLSLLHLAADGGPHLQSGTPVTRATAGPPPVTSSPMPVRQQNELVQKRCAPCHSGANPKGGLLLERFDAAVPDPAVARMMLIKIAKDGAISAAGVPVPDDTTREGLVSALSAAADAAPSDGWRVDLGNDPKGGHNIVNASILQELPSTTDAPSAVYELTVTCGGRTHRGEMTLATYLRKGSTVPMTDRALSPANDGSVRFSYKVDSTPDESARLYVARNNTSAPMALIPIPAQTLTISNLFSGESVSFSFSRLSPIVRRQLATCIPGGPTAG